jgi:hypothetical protein
MGTRDAGTNYGNILQGGTLPGSTQFISNGEQFIFNKKQEG